MARPEQPPKIERQRDAECWLFALARIQKERCDAHPFVSLQLFNSVSVQLGIGSNAYGSVHRVAVAREPDRILAELT